MKGYLLDTNICIFALRNEYGIIERMKQCGEANCFVADVKYVYRSSGWLRGRC